MKRGGIKARLILGSVKYKVDAGKTKIYHVKLVSGYKKLVKKKQLKFTVTARNSTGGQASKKLSAKT